MVLEATSDCWRCTSVITNVVGVTDRAIVEALIGGQRDPHILAGLAAGRARKKTAELISALDGTDGALGSSPELLAEIPHLGGLILSS